MQYNDALNFNFHHFNEIKSIIETVGFPLGGGSYMMDGQTANYNKVSFKKQELLYNSVAELTNPNILEIGFYAGHSALICFMANKNANIITIDNCLYSLSKPCHQYLSKHFDITLIDKPSHLGLLEIPEYSKFQLLHIDGSHDLEYAKNDFRTAKKFLEDGATVIWDDWDGFQGKIDDLYENLELLEVADCPNPCAKFKYKK
jgi:hypothetical protein